MMPEARMSSSSSMGSANTSTNSLSMSKIFIIILFHFIKYFLSCTGSTISTSRPWRRLSNIKNSLLGTPRFHRRKLSSGSSGTGESDSEENQMLESSE